MKILFQSDFLTSLLMLTRRLPLLTSSSSTGVLWFSSDADRPRLLQTTSRPSRPLSCEHQKRFEEVLDNTVARHQHQLTKSISGWKTAMVKSRLKTCRKSKIRLATRRPTDTARFREGLFYHSCKHQPTLDPEVPDLDLSWNLKVKEAKTDL